jgi:hypothetical protein
MPGAHAEITALSEARKNGLTPRALVTTKPFCDQCVEAIEAQGGRLLNNNTAVFPY